MPATLHGMGSEGTETEEHATQPGAPFFCFSFGERQQLEEEKCRPKGGLRSEFNHEISIRPEYFFFSSIILLYFRL